MSSDPDSAELLTWVTDDDSGVLGPVARGEAHGNPDRVHRAAHILVLNGDGHMLLQKRSVRKDTQPGKWDTSVGGHVGFGQSYEEAARREGAEELGVEFAALEPLYASKIRNAIESENIFTYLALHAGPFRHSPEEIEALRFWTRSEIEAALGTGTFTPNFEEEFAAFKECPRGILLG